MSDEAKQRGGEPITEHRDRLASMVGELQARLERLREASGCPPDSALEPWLKTLHACLAEANEQRCEIERLRKALVTILHTANYHGSEFCERIAKEATANDQPT